MAGAFASVRFVSAGVVALVAAVGLTSNRGEVGAAQAIRCADFRPRALVVADSFVAYADSPEIARSPQGTFVVGWPAFAITAGRTQYRVPGATDSSMLVGVLIDPTGVVRPLPEPTEARVFNPRPVVDPTGQLNILWVDGDSTGRSALTNRPIMWSRWLGSNWSTPDSVRRTAGLGIWRQNSVSPAYSDASTTFLIATFGVAASRTRAITWENGRWVAVPMPAFERDYLSLAGDGDTIVAVELGYGAPDGNAVYARRSIDHGKTYSLGVRISPAGTGMATDMRVFRLPGGRRVAVWIAERRREADLLAAFSDDGGASWHNSMPFKTGAGVLAMRAAATTTGKIVAIAQIGDPRRVVPTYVEWSDNKWSAPLPLIRDSSSSLGVANILGGDSVTMAWGEYAPGARLPMTKYVVLPADCRMP